MKDDIFGQVDREIERNRKSMRRLFATMVVLTIVAIAGVAWLIALVIANPEAIGGWFRRLFGGGA